MILNVNGKDVCTSDASYGKPPGSDEISLLKMSLCPGEIPLKKGDSLTLKSVYDLSKHPL
jgi:hypothetical protein